MSKKTLFKPKGFSTLGSVLKKFQSDDNEKPSQNKQNSKSGDPKKNLPLELSRDKQDLPTRFSQDKYISREFQKYGYDLAKELGDLKNISLYMKLAKTESRGFLETAKNFVKDANNVKSRPRLFMWKLSELKKAKKADTQEERRR